MDWRIQAGDWTLSGMDTPNTNIHINLTVPLEEVCPGLFILLQPRNTSRTIQNNQSVTADNTNKITSKHQGKNFKVSEQKLQQESSEVLHSGSALDSSAAVEQFHRRCYK